MDLSPKLLREVEFREQWRGYSPDEVDDFLERLAVAVEQLQAQLEDAVERASRAEQRLLESTASEDEVRRTLVLAQRTADAAREEAEAAAARVVADADGEAQRLLASAREEAERLASEAAERAARVDGEARDAARGEVERLAATRAALEADVDALERFLRERREALGRMADDLRSAIHDPSRLAAVPPPELAAGDLVADLGAAAAAPEQPEREEPLATRAGEPPATRAGDGGDTGAPDGGDTGAPDPDDTGPLALAVDEPGEHTRAHPAARPDETEEPSNGHLDPSGPDALGHEADDDPFLAELRRAVTDTEPLGPRDHVAHEEGDAADGVELYDQDLAPSRFRLRRRR